MDFRAALGIRHIASDQRKVGSDSKAAFVFVFFRSVNKTISCFLTFSSVNKKKINRKLSDRQDSRHDYRALDKMR